MDLNRIVLSAALVVSVGGVCAASNGSRDVPENAPPPALHHFEAEEIGDIDRGGEETTGCRAWWDNGSFDGVSGLNSQELFDGNNVLIFQALVADDFFLQFGKCYWIETVEVCFAVFGAPTPVVELRLYDDCNGKPGAMADLPANVFDAHEVIDEGPVPGWPGFTKYRFVFRTELFEYGYRRLWIVPVGQGAGLYYWLTANDGVVQGVQGQYKSAAMGVPNWTAAGSAGDDCGTCLIPCSDFSFRLCGKCCWLLKDNSEFDSMGLAQANLAMGTVFGTRVVDNFSVPPGKDIQVCRLEAWMATNCNPSRAFMEIYNNDCDTPFGNPIVLQDPEFEALMDMGGQPLKYNGLQVYRFSFTCPEIVLAGGRNYWLSVAMMGYGTPHEKAAWLFKQKNGCHINITEGQFKTPFLSAFKQFTPVSHPGLAGEPRDFAFRLYATDVTYLPGMSFPGVPGQAEGPATPPVVGVGEAGKGENNGRSAGSVGF